MQSLHASVILVLLYFSVAKVISDNSNSKMRRNPSKGAECSVSTGAHNVARIVGGVKARRHSWPWQALIRCIQKDSGKIWRLFGGGSIISDKWVITAAHVLNENVFNIRHACRVYLGNHNIQNVESTQVKAKIANYVIHEKNKIEFGYDLALIKLDRTLNFTHAIKPICLPFGLRELPVNKTCYATGWGSTVPVLGPKGILKMSDVLKQLPMTVQEELHCNATKKATGRLICTGQWYRGEGVCESDSGGPLACQEPDKTWYLRGVLISGSITCDSVAVSVKVAAFADWINNVIARRLDQ